MSKGRHVCKNAACAGEFRNNTKAFGNPLAAYKIENNCLVPNDKAKLNYIHRHAHGE